MIRLIYDSVNFDRFIGNYLFKITDLIARNSNLEWSGFLGGGHLYRSFQEDLYGENRLFIY